MIGLEQGKVLLYKYDEHWPEYFEKEKFVIISQIRVGIKGIEHIGSTSVPGLPAKPIIDIIIGIEKFEDGFNLAPLLETIGYEYKGENGIPGRHFFAKGNPRTHHLHMVQFGSVFWNEHLLFRDYLRKNPGRGNEYEELKYRLAEQYPNDREKYTDLKSDFIRATIKLAESNGW